MKFDALHVIEIWDTALKSPFRGNVEILGSRGPGFIPANDGGILKNGIPPAPTKKGSFWVLEARLCANCAHLFALAAQKSFSCGLFSLGVKSRLSRNQKVSDRIPGPDVKRNCEVPGARMYTG